MIKKYVFEKDPRTGDINTGNALDEVTKLEAEESDFYQEKYYNKIIELLYMIKFFNKMHRASYSLITEITDGYYAEVLKKQEEEASYDHSEYAPEDLDWRYDNN